MAFSVVAAAASETISQTQPVAVTEGRTSHFAEARPTRDRISLSIFSIARGSATAASLASVGQLGGSQAGLRVRLDLGSGFAAAARVSGPLRSGRGKEAALALDWKPVPKLPVTLTVERRFGLDGGGRDAFAAGVFGGFDSVRAPLGFRLDGYGQAGAVGLKRRDGFVDASVRVERRLYTTPKLTLGAGAGVWGGAQPGASRIDVGPQLVAHLPIANGGLRIGLEWRERIAGTAQPGSGAVLTLGADF